VLAGRHLVDDIGDIAVVLVGQRGQRGVEVGLDRSGHLLDGVVGSRALLDERGIAISEAASAYVHKREASGETAVYVALDGETVGAIAVRDEIRPVAAGVVRALGDAGVETVLLTGDNERTAAAAEAVGIDDYRAELLPEDKQAAVEAFQAEGHVVGMVGDGINDAPALATADVGIAMGAAGTDTAIETAEMALMADDLDRIPYAVALSKATRRNVAENVGLAVVTVGLLLAGVLTSYVHLAAGMLVHEASVLAVILNGMRLRRHRYEPPADQRAGADHEHRADERDDD